MNIKKNMTRMKATYLGELRVECEHLQSGTRLWTDAPLDNQGKGEAFSPTDLCATALGTCILTTMGIYARQHRLDIQGAEMEIIKEMEEKPRRIGRIRIVLHMPCRPYSQKERKVLERVARTCPVYYSLHEQLIKDITFNWPEF